MTERPWAPNLACHAVSLGADMRHARHHVAQKSRITTRPLSSFKPTGTGPETWARPFQLGAGAPILSRRSISSVSGIADTRVPRRRATNRMTDANATPIAASAVEFHPQPRSARSRLAGGLALMSDESERPAQGAQSESQSRGRSRRDAETHGI